MAGDIGKIRIRVPSNAKAGDVIRVRCLVIHPMERIERDAQGKIVDRNYNYITRVTATYLGKPVAVFDLTQSVSENPAFSFALKATAPGPVTVTVSMYWYFLSMIFPALSRSMRSMGWITRQRTRMTSPGLMLAGTRRRTLPTSDIT